MSRRRRMGFLDCLSKDHFNIMSNGEPRMDYGSSDFATDVTSCAAANGVAVPAKG